MLNLQNQYEKMALVTVLASLFSTAVINTFLVNASVIAQYVFVLTSGCKHWPKKICMNSDVWPCRIWKWVYRRQFVS